MRIARGLMLAGMITVVLSASATAQELAGKFAVTAFGGGNLPIQYLQQTDGGGSAKFGFAAGASGEYFVTSDISVGARFVFDRFGLDTEDFPDASGDWTILEFGVFGRYLFLPDMMTRPFVRAGLLMAKAKSTFDDGSGSATAETEVDLKLAPGAELAAGVIHEVADNISLYGEVGWTGVATDGKDADVVVGGTTIGTIEFEKHVQWVGAKVGVMFFLGGE